MLRLAFIFQSAILVLTRHRRLNSCGWLSFSRVLYLADIVLTLSSVAVGFHFPECYTYKDTITDASGLRLAFIFQSAILLMKYSKCVWGCGWLSFSRVLYCIEFGMDLPRVAVGFHFPECYTL